MNATIIKLAAVVAMLFTPVLVMAQWKVGVEGGIVRNTLINDFYAGELENSAFRIYTSTSMIKRVDGKCYEGYGVVPDIEALFNADEFYKGNDTQLNRAAEFIHTGK